MKILKFYADWCTPCKLLNSVIARYHGDVDIEDIDVEQNSSLADQYKIEDIPTCIIIDNQGNEVERVVGVMSLCEFAKFAESSRSTL